MIASSIEAERRIGARPGPRAIATGALSVLLAFACAGSALAQNAPISLLPQSQPKSPSAPAATPAPPTSAPAPAGAGTAQAPAPQAAQPVNPLEQKVEVQTLGRIDPGAVGPLDQSNGGFAQTMWAGTDSATVKALLPVAGLGTTSRVAQSLLRRLLLTGAAPPEGRAEGDPLPLLRARRLWAMGDLDDMAALLKLLPASALTPQIRRLRADAALLAGDNNGACAEAQPLATLLPNDPYPVELRVFCQFAAGKTNEAGLGVDVLREQKVNDPTFFLVADALSGTPPGKGVSALADPTPLVLAMARLGHLQEPPPAAGVSPAVLRSMALGSGAALDVRLVAAERAEAVGALDTDTLRRLYESVPFTAQELADSPSAKGDADGGPRARAQAYQASLHQDAPAARSALIAKALASAEGGVRYFGQARLYAPQIAGLQPSPELASFAAVAARALYAAGKADAASTWVGWLRAQAATDKNAAESAAALWALARLASTGAADGGQDDGLAQWLKVNGAPTVPRAERRAELVLGLLAALGQTVPAEAWAPLYAGPPAQSAQVPRPAVAIGLAQALAAKKLGGTVLFTVAALGEGNFAVIDPADLCQAVAALRAIGLAEDARALAVEVAVANGV